VRKGDEAIAFLLALLVAALIVGGIYVRAKAPCSALGWMPAKDVPARCLP
jgi:hypothetical protein